MRDITIPTQYKRLEEEKFLEVLDFKSPPAPLARPIQPSGLSMQHFFDSDFGKWIEAASYMLKYQRNPDIEAKIDDIVAKLSEGQMPDGYLNSWLSAASRKSAGPTCATCMKFIRWDICLRERSPI